jgi:hypothetical protein
MLLNSFFQWKKIKMNWSYVSQGKSYHSGGNRNRLFEALSLKHIFIDKAAPFPYTSN